jgi:hypothetical protein
MAKPGRGQYTCEDVRFVDEGMSIESLRRSKKFFGFSASVSSVIMLTAVGLTFASASVALYDNRE